jgi:hypothetical protein
MPTKKKATKTQKKVGKVMHEYKHGELHSGSKKGPAVKNRKQAIAIALSEARQAGGKVPPKKSGKKAAAKKTSRKSSAAKKS